MSSNHNDGGPAFPRPASTDEHDTPCNVYQDQGGMSLRQWFIGQALAGMPHIETDGINWIDADDMVARACKIADAALGNPTNPGPVEGRCPDCERYSKHLYACNEQRDVAVAALKAIAVPLGEQASQLGNTSARPYFEQVCAAIAKAEGRS